MQQEAFFKLSSGVKVLAGMGQEELRSLLASCRSLRVPRGGIIVSEGDPGETMYVLLSGKVSVWHDYHNRGRRQRIAKIQPGESFGEMAFLNGGTRSATILADDDCLLLEIHRQVLNSDVAVKLYRNIAKMLSYRLAEANTLISLVGESSQNKSLSTGIFQAVKWIAHPPDN